MYLQHLYPEPRSVTESSDRCFRFGADTVMTLSWLPDDGKAAHLKDLWNRFTCTAGTLCLYSTKAPGYTAVIGKRNPEEALLQGKDSYALSVTEAGVLLAAKSEKGLLDGFQTLLQLICPDELSFGKEAFHIWCAEIHDAPAIAFRSVHLCIFPDSKPSTIEKAVRMAGFLKFTHVVLEFWGTFPFRSGAALSWHSRVWSQRQVKELGDLVKACGMEVIPMINHFGHASFSRVACGRHTILNHSPRMAKLFEPDGWTWCLSNPDTYQVLAEMRSDLFEVFGKGQYFHLGFDEAYSFATCEKCRKRVPHELLAEYINHLTEDICAQGCRPIIWSDEFLSYEDFPGNIYKPVCNGQTHHTTPALDLLDRRVIIADWEYHYKDEINDSTPYFMNKGFDTVLCPWDNAENIRSLCGDCKRLGAYGMMLTTWHHLPDYMHLFPAAANCTWSESHNSFTSPWTETAALLRTLYDTDGDYETSGWSMHEVEG